MRFPRLYLTPLSCVCLMSVLSCTSATRDAERPANLSGASIELAGAGATFPYPVYTRWFSRFAEAGGARISYSSIGSGAGIERLLKDSLSFAATDAPLDPAEREQLAAAGFRLVPMVVGGVAITYNLPGIIRQVRVDGALLGAIFLGTVTRWDDARLRAINPDIALPAQAIIVVSRADSSGTSWILTDYLTRVLPAWAVGPGRSRFPAWPTGRQARGNEGVAAEVKATPYAIGAVEAVYAMQNRLSVARLRNHAGAWVTPQTGNLRAAADAMLTSMDDTLEFSGSIADAPGASSYPIASLSWLIVPSGATRPAIVKPLGEFVMWALRNGAEDALSLGYAPLPDAMRESLLRR
jgi:phosphate transport system substrate-binding protein